MGDAAARPDPVGVPGAGRRAPRLGSRAGKQDDAIFERLDFLEKATQGFHNPDYQHLFTSHGTALHYLPATAEIATMKAQSIEFLSSILK
jgi:hypothetical protein